MYTYMTIEYVYMNILLTVKFLSIDCECYIHSVNRLLSIEEGKIDLDNCDVKVHFLKIVTILSYS